MGKGRLKRTRAGRALVVNRGDSKILLYFFCMYLCVVG
jgi:hypothetical protein